MPYPKIDKTLTIGKVLGNLNTNLPGMNVNSNYTVHRTDEERKLLHASAVELRKRRRAKHVENFNNSNEIFKIRDAASPEEEEDRYEGYEKPSVIGMSGYDPLLGMWPETVATFGGAGTLFKTGLWNLAKRVPTSQLGNYGRLYFIGNAFKNSFNGAVPTLTPLLTSKNLFRTKVYKGGEITDPYSNFLTTDPKYAANYGKVFPYIFESKSIAKAKEPMMGSSDPVNMDMFIYHNTKENPNATAIIGHDAITGEFPPSKGVEIYSMSPTNLFRINNSKKGKIFTGFKQLQKLLDMKGMLKYGPSLITGGYFLTSQKQGGKMNIIEFLKKGSGIHIKKKNRGKFTEYCGGKVTDACIRKAKSSGNPTLVKRATFAANARKWKHRNGGLLFAQEGNKINWADISGAAALGLMNIYGALLLKKAVDKLIEADKLNDKANQAKLLNLYYLEELNKLLNETLPDGIHSSPVFNSYLAHLRALRRVLSEFLNNNDYAELQAAAQNDFTDSIIGAFGGVMNTGFKLLANKNKNNPPSSLQA